MINTFFICFLIFLNIVCADPSTSRWSLVLLRRYQIVPSYSCGDTKLCPPSCSFSFINLVSTHWHPGYHIVARTRTKYKHTYVRTYIHTHPFKKLKCMCRYDIPSDLAWSLNSYPLFDQWVKYHPQCLRVVKFVWYKYQTPVT